MISIPGKIPIRIFPFFWFLIIMIGWLNTVSLMGTAIWSIVIFISVLFHEYGHALTALAFGQKTEINLVGLGGLTKRHGASLAKWKEFLVVLNGPIAGFILFILSYKLFGILPKDRFPLVKYALEVSINVNLFWTIVNLLPVLPLDGGHLMRILLEGAFGFRGLKLAFLASIILATFFALYFFFLQQLLIGALFLMMAFESYRSWLGVKPMTAQDTDIHLQKLLKEAVADLNMGHRDQALSKFFLLREQSQKGVLYLTATQYIARILAEQGHFKQAYEWLLPIQKHLSSDYLYLLQQLAYRLQDWDQAAKIGQKAYQQEPSSEVALINALSYAIMGQATPAVGWLRCAVQSGLANVQEVIQKREFDAIRHTPEFESWLKAQRA
ncbi:site-2 protease family protein [Candidatus Protochlamydia phocaeensis]|uniref:site-2 protease family protein n=1 Tax=Candidatus Protochlamydia phocaeensis TaxID=1414722 RepID=UPI000839ACEF|nr:M50 family metallopeptidase [Candidatus Protochlamydia phocaeensis]